MSSADDLDDEFDDEAEPVPPPVTREQFLAWRSPRFGAANPDRLTNPVWEWLVRSRLKAWAADSQFADASAEPEGPCWCFERFGHSTTELPDGRTIVVAGAHEDWTDPNFHRYNDVVVRHPDDRIEIFGYPPEVFPPTDFHSATLVDIEGDCRLILIGNMGPLEQHRLDVTPVFVLDLESLAITAVSTSGVMPGWIHGHSAALADGGRAIVVSGGKRLDEAHAALENIDDWRLDLATWQWQRLTERRWPRLELRRADGQGIHLWDLQEALWMRRPGWAKDLAELLERLTRDLGVAPDLDLVERLFRPSVPHEALPEEEGQSNVVRIVVAGVVVRFVYGSHELRMTVEGDLPRSTVDAIAEELRARLASLQSTPWTLTPIGT